jgi:hypothetical protein
MPIRAIAIYPATIATWSTRRRELGIITSRSTLRASSEVDSEAAKSRECERLFRHRIRKEFSAQIAPGVHRMRRR